VKRTLLMVVSFLLLCLIPALAGAQDVQKYVNDGIANSQKGRYDQALQDFNQALQLKPKDPALITFRGITYYAKGNNAKAIEDFDAALAIDPKFGRAYYQRGMVYDNMEKYDKAVADLKTAKRLGYSVDPVFIETLEKKAQKLSEGQKP
jgi:tetratricopeptide (TPR) repeat protein